MHVFIHHDNLPIGRCEDEVSFRCLVRWGAVRISKEIERKAQNDGGQHQKWDSPIDRKLKSDEREDGRKDGRDGDQGVAFFCEHVSRYF